MKLQTIAFLSLVNTAFLPKCAESIQANPESYDVLQPDGSHTGNLLLQGDEFDVQEEDETGHTTMLDPSTGFIVYGMQESGGILAATALRPGRDNADAMGIPKHSGLAVAAEKEEKALFSESEQHRRQLWNEKRPPRRGASTGTMKNLVLLIRFHDHYQKGRQLPTVMDITDVMNTVGGKPGISPTGSVKDLFLKNSYNKLTVESFVFPWITVPQTESYYANNNRGLTDRTHQFIAHALDELEKDNFDFSAFDVNPKDGQIDAITVLHSGYGAEVGGVDVDNAHYMSRIWSHKSSLWSMYSGSKTGWTSSKKGVTVNDYHISPALWGNAGSGIGRIGVIAHETAHFLGLPDLYDSDGAGLGSFGLMGNSWGFDGSQLRPPHMSAWSKIELGWVNPTVITNSGVYNINDSARTPQIFRIDYGFPANEYLLIENRQKRDFDAGLPQGGLAIWHIDEKVEGNNKDDGYPGQSGWPQNGNHYKIALLQADGDYDLELGHGRKGNAGDGGDLFHGSGVNSIGPSTSANGPYPNTDSYQGGNIKKTDITISDISDSSDTMSFRVQLGDQVPQPTPSAPVSAPVSTPGSGRCDSWCASNGNSWSGSDGKCTWPSCAGCGSCSGGPAPTKAPVAEGGGRCDSWCAGNDNPWSEKCTWSSCKGCGGCSGGPAPTSAPVGGSVGKCDSWCAGNQNPWSGKCTWSSCKGCGKCGGDPPTPTGPCYAWCATNGHPWSEKCAWTTSCKGCGACTILAAGKRSTSLGIMSNATETGSCRSWCTTNTLEWDQKCDWKNCKCDYYCGSGTE